MEMKVMVEMGSSVPLHTMLFKEEKISIQAMNRWKREDEEWKHSEGPCSQEMWPLRGRYQSR